MRHSALSILLIWSSLILSSQDTILVQSAKGKLPEYRFFFKGEMHEFPVANAHSLFALLKYLHTNNSVRYLVMECGPDQAFLANRYLEASDDSLTKESKLYLGDIFWKQVNDFNHKLSPDQRIRVMGFDFNRYVHTVKVIKFILKSNQPDDEELQSILKIILKWDKVDWDMDKQKSFQKDLTPLLSWCERNQEKAKAIFGLYYSDLMYILNNTSSATPNVKRDKRVLELFLAALPALSKGNFLFNYGIAHTFLDGIGFAAILSDQKEWKNQVCSIYPYYVKNERSRLLTALDKDLPAGKRKEWDISPNNTLFSIEEEGLYPDKFSKSQWLLVIKAEE